MNAMEKLSKLTAELKDILAQAEIPASAVISVTCDLTGKLGRVLIADTEQLIKLPGVILDCSTADQDFAGSAEVTIKGIIFTTSVWRDEYDKYKDFLLPLKQQTS